MRLRAILDRRGIKLVSGAHLVASLDNLVELFGGSEELRAAIVGLKAREHDVGRG